MTGAELHRLVHTAPRTPWVWDADGNIHDAAGTLIATVQVDDAPTRAACAQLICVAANLAAPRVSPKPITDRDAMRALQRRAMYLADRLSVPGLTNKLLEKRDYAATQRALEWWSELRQRRKEHAETCKANPPCGYAVTDADPWEPAEHVRRRRERERKEQDT